MEKYFLEKPKKGLKFFKNFGSRKINLKKFNFCVNEIKKRIKKIKVKNSKMNSIDRMYPAMSAEELSNIILKGKGRCHYNFYIYSE